MQTSTSSVSCVIKSSELSKEEKDTLHNHTKMLRKPVTFARKSAQIFSLWLDTWLAIIVSEMNPNNTSAYIVEPLKESNCQPLETTSLQTIGDTKT